MLLARLAYAMCSNADCTCHMFPGLTAMPVAAAPGKVSCPSCPTCLPPARRLRPTKTARQPRLASLLRRRWWLLVQSLSHHASHQELHLTLAAAAAAAIPAAAPLAPTHHVAASCQLLLLLRVLVMSGLVRWLLSRHCRQAVRSRLLLVLYSSSRKSCGPICSRPRLLLASSRLALRMQFSNSFSRARCYSRLAFSIFRCDVCCVS